VLVLGLDGHLAADEVFFVELGSDFYLTGTVADFDALSESQKRRLRFVTGHAPLRFAEQVPNPFTFAIVREPVDRALSAYWYCFHNADHPAHGKARALSPVEFIAGGWGEARNGQARYLSGHSFSGGTPTDSELLEAAASALDRITYVGFFENLPAVVSDMCAIVGITPPRVLPFWNPAARASISEEDLKTIAMCNSVDVELYSRALQKYASHDRAL